MLFSNELIDMSENEIMKGKVVMITGANSGIGKETAIQLAKKGATIIMVCRNKNRGAEALKEIKEKGFTENIELYIADLADQNSIRVMAKEFKNAHKQLHVLINNAGVMLTERFETPEGYELTFATNHLGHFLLSYLLLDVLKKSAPARIINVASLAHRFSKVDFKDINLKNKYRGFRAYSNSKLYNILFTYKLARLLEGTGVTVNALHPGTVHSNLGSSDRSSFQRMTGAFNFLMKSARKGASTSVYLASSPEVENVTGKYFSHSTKKRSSKKSRNQSFQDKLWDISEKLTKLSQLDNKELVIEEAVSMEFDKPI